MSALRFCSIPPKPSSALGYTTYTTCHHCFISVSLTADQPHHTPFYTCGLHTTASRPAARQRSTALLLCDPATPHCFRRNILPSFGPALRNIETSLVSLQADLDVSLIPDCHQRPPGYINSSTIPPLSQDTPSSSTSTKFSKCVSPSSMSLFNPVAIAGTTSCVPVRQTPTCQTAKTSLVLRDGKQNATFAPTAAPGTSPLPSTVWSATTVALLSGVSRVRLPSPTARLPPSPRHDETVVAPHSPGPTALAA